MAKHNDKGNAYEDFSTEALLLKNFIWDYNKRYSQIQFDTLDNRNVIEGVSGQKHQIDIHLTSKKYPNVHLLCECKAYQSSVQKTIACSFITVINDIKKQHKDWKIIPVLAAENGFQAGAKIMLKYYKIIPLDMKECLKLMQITISAKINSPVLENLKGTLSDGSIVDNSSEFRNDSRGDIFCLENALGSFDVLDENGESIGVLSEYTGNFCTGKRTLKYDEDDRFYDTKTEKELISITGSVCGKKEIDLGKTCDTISTRTLIIKKDGKIQKINMDGARKK